MHNKTADTAAVVKEIHQLAGDLRASKVAPTWSERLEHLARELKNNHVSVARQEIQQLYHPSRLYQNIHEAVPRRSSAQNKLWLILRSLLVLLLAGYLSVVLSNVLSIYCRLASAGKLQNGHSLWQLWAGGFSGAAAPVISLQTVANISAALLMILLILTIWIRYDRTRQLTRAAREASRFSSRLDHILWRISLLPAETPFHSTDAEQRSLVILESLHEFIQTFHSQSKQLEQTISLEQQHLSELRERHTRELDNQQEMTEQIQQTSQNLIKSGKQFTDAMPEFQAAALIFTQEIGRLHQVQDEILSMLQRNAENRSAYEQSVLQIGQMQEKLVTASSENLSGSQQVIHTVEDLNMVMRQITESQLNLQNAIDDLIRANDGWIKTIQKVSPSPD